MSFRQESSVNGHKASMLIDQLSKVLDHGSTRPGTTQPLGRQGLKPPPTLQRHGLKFSQIEKLLFDEVVQSYVLMFS